jgi:hypothetical protein
MKTRFLRSCAATLFAFFSLALVASAFEGKVHMTMTGKKADETTTLVNSIKGALYRSDVTLPGGKAGEAGPSMSMIVNGEKKELITLMNDGKLYFVTTLTDLEKTADEVAKKNDIEFKPTGRKEKIAGYEAEEYVSQSKKRRGGRTEIWVTKGLGTFLMAQGKGSKPEDWQSFLQKNDLFMLRMINRDKEGSPEITRMEATKVEKMTLPASLFVPPADFQRFETPSMKDMMKGMIPGLGR